MVALTATDWIVTVEERRWADGKRRNRVKLQLPTAGEYTSSGIPMPEKGKLGCPRAIDYVHVVDQAPDYRNIMVRYDLSNHKLWMYSLGTQSITAQDIIELATARIPGGSTEGAGYVIYVEAVGS